MAGGLKGTVDWIGYPVGQPPLAPPAGGFKGLLDFAGYSVGKPSVGAAVTPLRTLMGIGTSFIIWCLHRAVNG